MRHNGRGIGHTGITDVQELPEGSRSHNSTMEDESEEDSSELFNEIDNTLRAEGELQAGGNAEEPSGERGADPEAEMHSDSEASNPETEDGKVADSDGSELGPDDGEDPGFDMDNGYGSM